MPPAKKYRTPDGAKRVDFRTGRTRHRLIKASKFGFCPKCGEHGLVLTYPSGNVLVTHVADYYDDGVARVVECCFVRPAPPGPEKKPKRKRKGKQP